MANGGSGVLGTTVARVAVVVGKRGTERAMIPKLRTAGGRVVRTQTSHVIATPWSALVRFSNQYSVDDCPK